MNRIYRVRAGKAVLIIAFLAAVLCVGAFFGVGERADSSLEFSACGVDEQANINAASPISGNITNLVIFICFSDENLTEIQATADERLINFYIGESNSLKDYYSAISYGKIEIETIFPRTETAYFIYQAPNRRSHYAAIKSTTLAATRKREESTLLNGAVKAANEYFDYNGVNLDVNSDGYVDSVSFLASGTYDSSDTKSWGGLLWPHSANLATYTSDSNGVPQKLNGLAIGEFSFNFMQTVDTGLVCHETGHVLGMPDLYHYNRDKNYIPVGTWDLMHSQNAVPQYPTAHLRYKYLNAIGDNQIFNIKSSGVYSLKPVTAASGEDTVACRLIISEKESIWMEYRSNSAGVYDSQLPSSGLIVYRVNSSVDGNENGGHNKPLYPDEVYIYRPSVSKLSDVRKNEEENLTYAAMSVNNEHFQTLGGTQYGGLFNNDAIFLSSGKNTGVKIEIIEQTDGEITFKVDANGYGSTEVEDIFVDGSPVINYGETPSITLKVKLKGFEEYFTANPSSYTVIYDTEKIGTQTAKAVYVDEEGNEITAAFTLTVKDKVEINGVTVERRPIKTSYDVGESINLSGLALTVRYVSGKTVTVEYNENNAHNWKIEGIDTSVSGVYNAKVIYTPFETAVYVSITILTELKSIRVSEKNTTTVVDFNGSLAINIEGVNDDGTIRQMTADEVTVSAISKTFDDLYKPQKVTVVCRENPSLTCEKTVYVVDFSELVNIERTASPSRVIKYGQSLDLKSGLLKLNFSNGATVTVPMENYYDEYNSAFSSTKRGSQELKMRLGSAEEVFTVTVLAPDNAILSADSGVYVNTDGKYVRLDKSMTVREGESGFTSYLNVRFVYREGDTIYTVNSHTHADLLLSSNITVELINDEGLLIDSYRVYVTGDINGDGKANADDIDGWADALFRNVQDSVLYLDLNSDGAYTLTDFALLIERFV